MAQPAQLHAKLFDHKFDHPDSFMKAMADFFLNRAQGRFFTGEFRLTVFLPPLELFAHDARRSLPGKRHPGEEWRTVALGSPVCALEGSGQGRAAFGGGGRSEEHTSELQ